jgi:Tol biopolymer transport system component
MLGPRWCCLLLLFAAWLRAAPRYAIVFTQAPAGTRPGSAAGDGARLALLKTDGSIQILTPGFDSAADPEISFDGKRLLFSAKRSATDNWDIYEMEIAAGAPRRITRSMGNCRSPIYQSAIFYLNDPRPSYQITFTSELDERDGSRLRHLYSVMPDGTGLRRLTYNLTSNLDPVMTWDGRIIFAAGPRLFGIHLDGTDYALAAESRDRRQRMPAATPDGLLVFVEPNGSSWDAGGTLAGVTLRRPLHSYRRITRAAEGQFHSPSPLPDGSILVARRPAGGAGQYGIYRLTPADGRAELIHQDPAWNEMQPRALAPRAEPDGHSSVVEQQEPTGKLYCLNAYDSELGPDWIPKGSLRRLRVLEGTPRKAPGETVRRRFLGELDIEDDGSFQIQVPAATPIQLQLLDQDGLALRTSSWIWVMNKQNRGCIGCHEDPERTPENLLAKALTRPAVQLTLPPERRRRVEFQRDVQPILKSRCMSRACHDETVGSMGIDPGRARTSRLVWSILGRNTSRPWDGASSGTVRRMPPPGSTPLTAGEIRTIIEWVDLGALRDRAPGDGP